MMKICIPVIARMKSCGSPGVHSCSTVPGVRGAGPLLGSIRNQFEVLSCKSINVCALSKEHILTLSQEGSPEFRIPM